MLGDRIVAWRMAAMHIELIEPAQRIERALTCLHAAVNGAIFTINAAQGLQGLTLYGNQFLHELPLIFHTLHWATRPLLAQAARALNTDLQLHQAARGLHLDNLQLHATTLRADARAASQLIDQKLAQLELLPAIGQIAALGDETMQQQQCQQ